MAYPGVGTAFSFQKVCAGKSRIFGNSPVVRHCDPGLSRFLADFTLVCGFAVLPSVLLILL